MKQNDKVTLTFGQLKKLVKEGKTKRTVKESSEKEIELCIHQAIYGLINDPENMFSIIEKWSENNNRIPFKQIAKLALEKYSGDYGPSVKRRLTMFLKGTYPKFKQFIVGMVNNIYFELEDGNNADDEDEEEEEQYSTWSDIFDYLERYEDSPEDLKEIAEDPDIDADRFFDYYGMLENGMHVAGALQHIAELLLKGKTIAQLRKSKYYQGEL